MMSSCLYFKYFSLHVFFFTRLFFPKVGKSFNIIITSNWAWWNGWQGLEKPSKHNFYILGVVGIGRIGKTTLVKKLYYQIQGEFQKSIFWENVKSMVVKHVEEQLLKHLCGMELEDIRNFHQHLKECWMEKRYLWSWMMWMGYKV